MAAEVLVLCYHALSPTWDAALSTTPARFERQLAELHRRGYRGARFSDAVLGRAGGRVVAITFDDAYRSVIELARPILDELNMPATVFAPTDFIDAQQAPSWSGVDRWQGGEHARELTPMSWSELRLLAGAGWEIGSHTCSHPRLTTLDDRALADELERSMEACRRGVQGECSSLAYPYGDVDERVVAATARAGYRAAAALPERWLGKRSALQWPRIGIYHVDDGLRYRLKISPAVVALRSLGGRLRER
jgi:peptidoglycan/xylan/chitin deacetylase (PgdA/CDA1 family)